MPQTAINCKAIAEQLIIGVPEIVATEMLANWIAHEVHKLGRATVVRPFGIQWTVTMGGKLNAMRPKDRKILEACK